MCRLMLRLNVRTYERLMMYASLLVMVELMIYVSAHRLIELSCLYAYAKIMTLYAPILYPNSVPMLTKGLLCPCEIISLDTYETYLPYMSVFS